MGDFCGAWGEGIHPSAEVASVYSYLVEKPFCLGPGLLAQTFKNRRSKVYKCRYHPFPEKGSLGSHCQQAASDSEKNEVVSLTHFSLFSFSSLEF